MSIDPATKTLSRIFDWYKDDFGNVLAFVSRYRSDSEKAVLSDGKWTLKCFEYDWSLNGTQASPAEQP